MRDFRLGGICIGLSVWRRLPVHPKTRDILRVCWHVPNVPPPKSLVWTAAVDSHHHSPASQHVIIWRAPPRTDIGQARTRQRSAPQVLHQRPTLTPQFNQTRRFYSQGTTPQDDALQITKSIGQYEPLLIYMDLMSHSASFVSWALKRSPLCDSFLDVQP